ncbi:MAG: hypothetical protein R3C61_06440 [Bacteroidia bacterium]
MIPNKPYLHLEKTAGGEYRLRIVFSLEPGTDVSNVETVISGDNQILIFSVEATEGLASETTKHYDINITNLPLWGYVDVQINGRNAIDEPTLLGAARAYAKAAEGEGGRDGDTNPGNPGGGGAGGN